MSYVQAFITSITFPSNMDELFYYGREFDNIENILGISRQKTFETGDCCKVEWTSPQWAKTNDIVLFYYGKTAIGKMKRFKKELLGHKDEYNVYKEKEFWNAMNCLNRNISIWNEYGGKIFAIGRVSKPSYYRGERKDEFHYWRNPVCTLIDSVFVLENSVCKSEFDEIVKLSQHGAITPVLGKNFEDLQKLILKKNTVVWDYFKKAESKLVPFEKITKDNWISIGNDYRRKFILEAQFRAHYVDYLLPSLGDKNEFYKECDCIKQGKISGTVDNVLYYKSCYLPVEVKININTEKNLPEQLDKYINVDTVRLTKTSFIDGLKMKSCVLVIDTENVYIYNGSFIKQIFALDNLKDGQGVDDLKQIIKDIVEKSVV